MLSGGSSYYNSLMIGNGELVNEESYITTKLITYQGIGYMKQMMDNDDPFYLIAHLKVYQNVQHILGLKETESENPIQNLKGHFLFDSIKLHY